MFNASVWLMRVISTTSLQLSHFKFVDALSFRNKLTKQLSMTFMEPSTSRICFVPCFLSWIMISGAVPFTVLVFGSEVCKHGFSNSDEVGNVVKVGNIGVEVVLEVLEHVHVLVNNIVSSDSWERE